MSNLCSDRDRRDPSPDGVDAAIQGSPGPAAQTCARWTGSKYGQFRGHLVDGAVAHFQVT